MRIIKTIKEMQRQARAWHRDGKTIGLVPTMGALHDGHLSLIRRAKQLADVVVVSIFVNPTQFGPDEDLDAYPRTWDSDREGCHRECADAIFFPSSDEMYPHGASTWVVEEQLSLPLCGDNRPGHFRGVTTIVTKLFNAATPDIAVFGQKDAQQALIIERMVRDLNIPVEVEIAPIIREKDGLAMSSRNRYLSDDERQQALAIRRGLIKAEKAFAEGERKADVLTSLVRNEIAQTIGRIDYIELRDASNLTLVGEVKDRALLAVAAQYGPARLIDNSILG